MTIKVLVTKGFFYKFHNLSLKMIDASGSNQSLSILGKKTNLYRDAQKCFYHKLLNSLEGILSRIEIHYSKHKPLDRRSYLVPTHSGPTPLV